MLRKLGLTWLYGNRPAFGPVMMTHIFSYFSSGSAPVYFPGAAFLASAGLTLGSIALFLIATRSLVRPTAKER